MHSRNPLWSAFAAYDFLRSPNISDGFRNRRERRLERFFQELLDRGCSYDLQEPRSHERVGLHPKYHRIGSPQRPGAFGTLTPNCRSTKAIRLHFWILGRVVNQHVSLRVVPG